MTINRKIVNATPTEYNGIKFRSKLECRVAQILDKNNISYQYEPFKIQYIPKFEYKGQKYRAAFYTPDFVAEDKYIIEVKGYQNDVYRYKKKLILLELMKSNKYEFIEIKTLGQLNLWINEYKRSNKSSLSSS